MKSMAEIEEFAKKRNRILASPPTKEEHPNITKMRERLFDVLDEAYELGLF